MTTRILITFLFLLPVSWAQAAIIAEYDGTQDQLGGFINLNGNAGTWQAPGVGTPISPVGNTDYDASGYPTFYGFMGGTTYSIQGNQPNDYIALSAGSSVGGAILIAPMFLTNATGVTSLDVTPRNIGGGGNLTRQTRMTVEVNGSDYYISDGQSIGTGATTFTPNSWFDWNPASDPFAIGSAAPAFNGTGNITAVGYWLTETDDGTGSATLSQGVAVLTFNGTAIPEPSALSFLAVACAFLLARRSRRVRS